MCARGEQGVHGVVAGDDETSKVGEKLSTEIENDEEEVKSAEADEGIRLGHAGLALEVVKGGVLGELRQAVLAIGQLCEGVSDGDLPPCQGLQGSSAPSPGLKTF